MSVSSHFFWKIILHYDNFFLKFATTATTPRFSVGTEKMLEEICATFVQEIIWYK